MEKVVIEIFNGQNRDFGHHNKNDKIQYAQLAYFPFPIKRNKIKMMKYKTTVRNVRAKISSITARLLPPIMIINIAFVKLRLLCIKGRGS